jgi:hypothetical protein
MATIAGHDFRETPGGRVCVGHSMANYGPCGARWLHVRTATEADIERPYGFAHLGKMNWAEYREIRKEVEREEAAIWEAVVDAASAGTH